MSKRSGLSSYWASTNMEKLYIDCNILIDWLTDREPFSYAATVLISEIERKHLEGYVSPLTLANTHFILRRTVGKAIAYSFLQDSKRLFTIVDLTREQTLKAIDEKYRDFEDDLHYATAQANGITYIITRNKKDFVSGGTTRIATAEEFLKESGGG